MPCFKIASSAILYNSLLLSRSKKSVVELMSVGYISKDSNNAARQNSLMSRSNNPAGECECQIFAATKEEHPRSIIVKE